MVFDNLIDNAIKYGGKVPEVGVAMQLSGRGQVIVSVVDNGQGIPPKLRRKIFGRFVRLGSELERSRTGTGLGLFIVRELVKRLRGQVTVRDRVGQSGTVFEVRLPIEVRDTPPPTGQQQAVPPSEPVAPPG
jgi:signal transduction histidine kinase